MCALPYQEGVGIFCANAASKHNTCKVFNCNSHALGALYEMRTFSSTVYLISRICQSNGAPGLDRNSLGVITITGGAVCVFHNCIWSGNFMMDEYELRACQEDTELEGVDYET